MKFLSSATAVLTLLAPLPISASLFGSSQSPIQDTESFPVPGDNPLLHCANPAGDILSIESVDLFPNPPVAGQTLTIKANGTVHETIEQGTTVLLDVKWNNVITLIHQTVDFCEQIKNVDLECPLEKGFMELEKQVEMPSQIPKGTFSILADVLTLDKDKVTCLHAEGIKF
jgi:hypothetical protein